jgi:hypothetical protein
MEITAGRLDPAVDPSRFNMTVHTPSSSTGPRPSALANNRADFAQALLTFKWTSHPDVLALPEAARSFVLLCLARDPASRFKSAAEALAHPFLADAAEQVQLAADAVAEKWQASNQQLRMIVAAARKKKGRK